MEFSWEKYNKSKRNRQKKDSSQHTVKKTGHTTTRNMVFRRKYIFEGFGTNRHSPPLLLYIKYQGKWTHGILLGWAVDLHNLFDKRFEKPSGVYQSYTISTQTWQRPPEYPQYPLVCTRTIMKIQYCHHFDILHSTKWQKNITPHSSESPSVCRFVWIAICLQILEEGVVMLSRDEVRTARGGLRHVAPLVIDVVQREAILCKKQKSPVNEHGLMHRENDL